MRPPAGKALMGASLFLVISVFLCKSASHGQPVLYEWHILAPESLKDGDNFGISVSMSGNYAIIGANLSDTLGSSSGIAFVFEYDGNAWLEHSLVPEDGDAGDNFGRSVGISGDYAIVGAWGHDTLANDSGAAYIFRRDGGAWVQDTILVPSEVWPYQHFGFAVAIDGESAIVGAYMDGGGGVNSGAAYIFSRTGGVWTLQQQIRPDESGPSQEFGRTVDIRGDFAIIGAPWDSVGIGSRTGAAYVFERDGAVWTQARRLLASDGDEGDCFGGSVGIDGTNAIVGAEQHTATKSDQGAAYIYSKVSAWTHETKLIPGNSYANDSFGSAVSISGEFAMIGASGKEVFGATNAGEGYAYTLVGSEWNEGRLRASDYGEIHHFGEAASIGPSKRLAIFGAPGWSRDGETCGAAYVYTSPYRAAYFVHLSDAHIDDTQTDKWDALLTAVLNMDPQPRFIVCSGDLVPYGAGLFGYLNLNALITSSRMRTVGSGADRKHYVVDENDTIPIYFSPGNHDRRFATLSPTPHSLDNYRALIHEDENYGTIVDSTCALFCLDSGHDRFDDKKWPWCMKWPEGDGLLMEDLNSLEDFLDGLDQEDNDSDGSDYTKVVFMHHPHKAPDRGRMCSHSDGEFIRNNDDFIGICEQYGVDYVLCGHLHKKSVYNLHGNNWSPRDTIHTTKCFAGNDAEGGDFHWHEIGGKCSGNLDLWDTHWYDVMGDAAVYVIDDQGDTTGVTPDMLPDSVALRNIPLAYFDRFRIEDFDSIEVHETFTRMTLLNEPGREYTVFIEAMSEDTMTMVFQHEVDGETVLEVFYQDIPMKFVAGPDTGSVATLTIESSGMDYTLTVTDPDGTVTPYTPLILTDADLDPEDDPVTPRGAILLQVYPNPFNATAEIRYAVPAAGDVRITLYDATGRRVRRLVDARRSAGWHTEIWDGRSDRGVAVSSGVYFCRVRTARASRVGKMVLLR